MAWISRKFSSSVGKTSNDVIFSICKFNFNFQAGTPIGICIRRRMILRGGRFGPWRFIPGTVAQGFRPNFAGVGGGVGLGFPGVSDNDKNSIENSNRIL